MTAVAGRAGRSSHVLRFGHIGEGMTLLIDLRIVDRSGRTIRSIGRHYRPTDNVNTGWVPVAPPPACNSKSCDSSVNVDFEDKSRSSM